MPFARAADKVRIYLVVLSPASHFGNRDQLEAWSRTVLEFLARCDRRRRG